MNRLMFIGCVLLCNYETVFGRKTRKIPDVDYLDYNTIPGVAGKDYPAYAEVPLTNFYCDDKMAGYYADPYYGCQVYHKCDIDGRRDSFLCTNGTIFNQEKFVCDWWYSVDCSKSKLYYGLNSRLYRPDYKPSAYTNEHRGATSARIYFAQRPHNVLPYLQLKPVDEGLYNDFLKFLRGTKNSQEYKTTKYVEPVTAASAEGESYEAGSQEEDNASPAPVKIYKAQPLSPDGKAKVEPLNK